MFYSGIVVPINVGCNLFIFTTKNIVIRLQTFVDSQPTQLVTFHTYCHFKKLYVLYVFCALLPSLSH